MVTLFKKISNSIKAIFSNSNDDSLKETIFFHEDDYRQKEIIPSENLNVVTNQIELIKKASKENFDGYGYKDLIIRKENSILLRDKNIKTRELDSILEKLNIQKHTVVTTGYGQSYRVKSENTIGYGIGYSAIYYNFDNEYVTNIWFTHFGEFEKPILVDVLNEIGRRWNLSLVDWSREESVDLVNKDKVETYLTS